MSEENVEIVRQMITAFAEGDDERLVELFDPQIEYDVSRTSPESRVAHGQEELAKVIEQWLATWDDHRLELVDLIDAGDEWVVALMNERGKMKGSDTWVEHQVGVLFTLHDGRITRYEEYQDKAGALEAAGLRE
ncbi:MAG TPA: nuclear transport factor 2 family protein [Solirubrobacterales bacterium]|jgi:ketosteroid isomerase-like protein|nr:nuclear transport factor 2 family protein [Solirubrobacterales bacterium]